MKIPNILQRDRALDTRLCNGEEWRDGTGERVRNRVEGSQKRRKDGKRMGVKEKMKRIEGAREGVRRKKRVRKEKNECG